MGRPTKCTPELRKKICNAIEAGNYPETAAEINGIPARTFYVWMKKGRESKSKRGVYHQFHQAVKKAEKVAEAYYLQHIRKAAEGDAENGIKPNWTASAWYLERKYPEKWGRKERLDIKGDLKQDINMNQTVTTVNRLFKLAEEGNEEAEQDGEEHSE
jgi:transposase